jgi:hypothetical protein
MLAETDRSPSGPDECGSVTQLINAGGSVEERFQDMQVSNQTNVTDEQKGESRQYVSNRIVCTYHPGRVREKVVRIKAINCNTNPLGSSSHVVSYILRPLAAFSQQHILKLRTPKLV